MDLLKCWSMRAKAVAAGAFAALLAPLGAQASLYRVDFVVSLDSAWYASDPAYDPGCTPLAAPAPPGECAWISALGAVGTGYFVFDSTWPPSAQEQAAYHLTIPAISAVEFPFTYTAVTVSEGRWSASSGIGVNQPDVLSRVLIEPGAPLDGSVPDLSSATASSFHLKIGSSTSPTYCPRDYIPSGGALDPPIYGSCGGDGHVESLTVSLLGEPGSSLGLVALALAGCAWARRRARRLEHGHEAGSDR